MTNSTISAVNELNEQQKTAVLNDINTFTKIVAGAGTGKTKIISKRYVKLVKDLEQKGIDNPVERLLVITFTDKAAAEMKERIFKELQKNNISFGGQENWISTIHGFCSSILKRHAFEIGFSQDYKLADDKTQEEIYETITKKISLGEIGTIENIEQIFDELEINKDIFDIKNLTRLKKFNALNTIFNDIFCVIKKIKSLGLTPKQFMEQSITAVKNYSETIKTIPYGFSDPEGYYSAWSEHLRAFADKSCNMGEDVIKELLKKNSLLNKNGKRKAEFWSAPNDFPENTEPITKNEIYLTKIIAAVYAIYQLQLQQNNLVDFDDLINKTLILFDKNEAIRTYYKKHFKHIIVDEFQDTSTAQMKLILWLISDEAPNLTIVGDRKQSIYGFRYAKMENLDIIQQVIEDKFKTKYPEIKLITNYRSNPKVLDVVNFVTENELLLEEKLFPDTNREFNSNEKNVKITKITDVKNARELTNKESVYIANEILKIREQDKVEFKDFAILVEKHDLADIMQQELLKLGIPSVKKVNTDFFKDKTIKNIIEMFKFLQDIRNELSLVRILQIKLSDRELYQLNKSMYRFLSEKLTETELKDFNFAQKLLNIYSNGDIKNLDIEETTKNYISSVYETIFYILENKSSLSLSAIFNKLTEDIKAYYNLNEIEQNLAEKNIKIFGKIIVDFSQTQIYASIKKFNEYIESIREDKSFELPEIETGEINAVKILTIHASKGLEFPYVFVCHIKKPSIRPDGSISFELGFLDKNNFGIIINKYNDKESPKYTIFKEIYKSPRAFQEKLRLFYVVLSRAKNFLHIITFEKFTQNTPAEYVSDLCDEYQDIVENI